MDKYIITFSDKNNNKNTIKTTEDMERIIREFHEFLHKEEGLLLMNEEIFNNIKIYKVDLDNNSIEKMEIKGK